MVDDDAGFVEFLVAAKRATYAAQGDDATVAPLLPDSKQLEFREGAYLYRDIYVGMFRFVGQEVVYRADRALWSMSYAGGLAPGVERADARRVYAFVRSALLTATSGLPVRGPAELREGALTYRCVTHGTLERFHGDETIDEAGRILFELRFAGGELR